jgi:hypothetical protein
VDLSAKVDDMNNVTEVKMLEVTQMLPRAWPKLHGIMPK